MVVALVALGALAGDALRGRAAGPRATPRTYLLHALALVFLVVGTGAAGLLVHDLSELVGPAPLGFAGSPPVFPPCDTSPASGSGPASTTTTLPLPCVQYPDASGYSSSSLGSAPMGQATPYANGGPVVGYNQFIDFGSGSKNAYISDSVAAGV